MVTRRFFSGSSLAQAVLAAARYHSLDPSSVAYSVRRKKHGFLNVRRGVVIEVDPAYPEKDDLAMEFPIANESRDLRETGSASIRSETGWQGINEDWFDSELEVSPHKLIQRVVDRLNGMLGLVLESTSTDQGERLEIAVYGSDDAVLLENDGRGLEAIQHLMSRVLRTFDDRRLFCDVDCRGFKREREAALQKRARDSATEAVESGIETKLEPMDPGDRRTIHMELAEHEQVRTESEGHGFMKRVRIIPMTIGLQE